MPDLNSLYLFSLAALVLLVVPGPNMAFVTSHALAYGWRAGFAAALGNALADLVLTLLVSAGVGALVMSWAPAFEILRMLGAAYLLWMAWQAVKDAKAPTGQPAQLAAWPRVLLRAALNSLLNPKALLFFMVFLPQFVTLGNGHVALQLLVLGALLSLMALLFNAFLAAAALLLKRRLVGGSRRARLANYGFAGVMAALAIRLVFFERST
ncbi:LysE family translocator [uncultured Pseudomonas sp.]|uniref:LysE family translocator n=1 Tax=uncultured Pseudomonas sp. TaxID=114707 RepID=UPI0025F74385|nr:LysE family translocator [uncultured Pseudomonas sp.]